MCRVCLCELVHIMFGFHGDQLDCVHVKVVDCCWVTQCDGETMAGICF